MRPNQFRNTLMKYISLADDLSKIFFLVSLDSNDPTIDQYNEFLNEVINYNASIQNLINGIMIIGDSKSKIDAVNRDIEAQYQFDNLIPLGCDIILVASDDMIPIKKGYDTIIRQKMQINFPDTDGALWFYDGRQNRINTIECIGRKYYQRFNYIYHPDYKSFFCDNEQTEVGLKLGKLKFINECIIKHEHPGHGGSFNNDELYKINSIHWKHDEELYKKRKINGFK